MFGAVASAAVTERGRDSTADGTASRSRPASSKSQCLALYHEEVHCARIQFDDQSHRGGGTARKTHGSICEGLCTDDSGQVVSRP